MGGLHWAEMLSLVLFWAVCAMAGALILMQRVAALCRYEKQFGLPAFTWIGPVIGGLAGAGMAGIGIYFYFFAPPAGSWVEWVGRSAYALISGSSATHLLTLVHFWRRLNAEGNAQPDTLTARREQQVEGLCHSRENYADRKARDDDAIDDLIAVFGDRLLTAQRALSRIPFYGYLGTVCGILLMAEELTRLDEATETFKVLRDMADGLVLAFQTTLVALLAYLPLRKGYDVLLSRMSDLERDWLGMRDVENGP